MNYFEEGRFKIRDMQNRGFKKYRSDTVRLKSWDYGWNGVYFVTICAHKRECHFGKVVGLNIDDDDDGRNDTVVETQNLASLRSGSGRQKSLNKFGPQSKNLPSIIRGFKIGVTKSARKIVSGFKWQPKYHDHIIRDQESYNRISEYIRNNPEKWAEDKYHTQ
ncbi:MAG: hypothetical protein WD357_01145 [Gracilimonas sp.]